MSVVKETFNLENIFGDLSNFIIRTNFKDRIKVGRTIKIVNPTCEWEYDCISGSFASTMYAYIVDLDLIDSDLSLIHLEKRFLIFLYSYLSSIHTKIP